MASKFDKIKDSVESMESIQRHMTEAGIDENTQEKVWASIDKENREAKRNSESIKININQASTKTLY